MLLSLQIGAILAMVLYLGQRRSYSQRRNRTSWESLILELQQWSPDRPTPWIRFQRARVVIEIVDYAALHGTISFELLERADLVSLRKEAAEDRLSAMMAMVRNLFPNAGQTRSA